MNISHQETRNNNFTLTYYGIYHNIINDIHEQTRTKKTERKEVKTGETQDRL